MAKKSAGLLVYYHFDGILKVLLVHPGGPFFAKKDAGVWSIPKGEYEEGEDPLQVAMRELQEETGNSIKHENFIALSPVKLQSGKTIVAWAAEALFEPPFIESNLFAMEWPPKSGRQQQFYETDNAAYFSIAEAREKIHPRQVAFITELQAKLDVV